MRLLFFLSIFSFLLLNGCSQDESNLNTFVPEENEFEWIIPTGTLNGSFNPFQLANNPTFTKASEVNFISDASIVAMVSFGGEIRVYPYQYISTFESVNDIIDGNNITMSYCPITESGLCINRNFKEDTFILRASGYLHNENVVLFDENSDTFWSQMKAECIKGKYATETINTFNFIETTWKTVEDYFGDALVFTNTSIVGKSSNHTKNKDIDIKKNELVYGILNQAKEIKNNSVNVYRYPSFINTKLFTYKNSGNEYIIIGNNNLKFITSYINDSNAIFTAIQNQFPIIMEDDQNNKWNIFGVAVEGPRKGHQLNSPTAFVASWWAWDMFYDDFIFNE